MSARSLRFVSTAEGVTAEGATAELGVEAIVVDTAWSPPLGTPSEVAALRPLVARALIDHQPLAEAMTAIDRWAEAAGLVERMTVGATSHWYRRRLYYWRWLQDRAIWLDVLRRVADGGADGGPIAEVTVPADEHELVEIAGLMARQQGWNLKVVPVPGSSPAGAAASAIVRRPSVFQRAIRRLTGDARRGAARRRVAVAARDGELAARVGELASAPRLLVLTDPVIHQVVSGLHGSTSIDPFLGPVVDALSGTRLDPVILELGTSHHQEATWTYLLAPGRERILPGSILGSVYADPADDAVAAAGARSVADRLAEPLPGVELAGIDLGPAIAAELRAFAAAELPGALRASSRIARFLRALRPAGILLINEYSRSEWIEAAHLTGTPIFAVQHGIIHRWHAGYVLPARTATLPLVDRTYVFGEFEKRLLTERSVYRPGEVVVAGSPRLDLVPSGSFDAGSRHAVRTGFGVNEDDRLLVISSTSSVTARRFTLAVALDWILDRELPRVHLLVKLHPAEDDGVFYRRLVAGLAAARGFDAPPLTIVRDADLYRLLQAADAHLGVYSTVLTDAVAAGTPNLIVTRQAGADLLDYVAAGVARPVRDGGDLLSALGHPGNMDARGASRAAFLADHFEPGVAADRIAADLLHTMSPEPDEAGAERGPNPGEWLTLRPLAAGDTELLFAWANDPVTRAASFSPEPIERAEHLAWFDRQLAGVGCGTWIGLDPSDGRPVGVVRFELDDDGRARVSISVERDARGRGLGRRMLGAGIEAARGSLQPNGFRAWIRIDNAASASLFRNAGFRDGIATPDSLELLLE